MIKDIIFGITNTANMTQTTEYKGHQYTRQDIEAMREWITDCQWGDLEEDEIAELSPLQVLRGIERNVDGGLAEFMANMI